MTNAIGYEALFDGQGRHLGGIHEPLLVNGELTAMFRAHLVVRPVPHLMWVEGGCADPQATVALCWMVPYSQDDPFALCPAVLPYVVQALDLGTSVMLHAPDVAAVEAIRARVKPLIGGWWA